MKNPRTPREAGKRRKQLRYDDGTFMSNESRAIVESDPRFKEARASVSLDGCTQSCEACNVEGWLARDISEFKKGKLPNAKERVFDAATAWFDRPAHTCIRGMTEAERELVEAAVRWFDDRLDWKLEHSLMTALKARCEAVRAERRKA